MKQSINWIAIEVFAVFLFVMALVWILPPIFVFLASVFILLSWKFHRDSLKNLGVLPRDFSQIRNIGIGVLISAVAFSITALVYNPEIFSNPKLGSNILRQFERYVFWAFLQQLVFHGYFTHRIQTVFNDVRNSSLVSGLMFAAVHLPNPILTGVSLIYGPASAYFFLRSRNIYILALAHAVLGTLLNYLVIKCFFHHGMRIGPAFNW